MNLVKILGYVQYYSLIVAFVEGIKATKRGEPSNLSHVAKVNGNHILISITTENIGPVPPKGMV